MRQGDAVGLPARQPDAERPADDLMERRRLEKPPDREPANRDDQRRVQELELRSSQRPQASISSGAGTRSPPRGNFPGKQRHTAAK